MAKRRRRYQFDQGPRFEGKQTYYLPIERLNIVEWSPTPHGKPVTQVHFVISIEEADFVIGLRFSGPVTMGNVIKAMIEHRRNVWPGASEDWND